MLRDMSIVEIDDRERELRERSRELGEQLSEKKYIISALRRIS